MPIRPRAGALDKRVQLLRPVTTLNATGAHVTTFEDAGGAWANVRQITLRESLRSQVELQQETYTVMIRYRSGVSPAWALSWDDKRYRILSIECDRSTGYIIIGCELDNSIVQEATT